MADTPTTVAVVATSLSTVVLTVGRLLARKEPHGLVLRRLYRVENRLISMETLLRELRESIIRRGAH